MKKPQLYKNSYFLYAIFKKWSEDHLYQNKMQILIPP